MPYSGGRVGRGIYMARCLPTAAFRKYVACYRSMAANAGNDISETVTRKTVLGNKDDRVN